VVMIDKGLNYKTTEIREGKDQLFIISRAPMTSFARENSNWNTMLWNFSFFSNFLCCHSNISYFL